MARSRIALLIGIDYRGTSYELSGCYNDIIRVQNYLMHVAGFSSREILRMSERQGDILPTKQNILQQLSRLFRLPSHDILIYFSGHGESVQDKNGDEIDGRDETLCPLDCQQAGQIIDDDIYAMYGYLSPDTRVVFCQDSCHSGTMGDVSFAKGGNRKVTRRNTSGIDGKNIISISGCKDNQTSTIVRGAQGWESIMTSALLSSLTRTSGLSKKDTSLGALQSSMHQYITKMNYSQRPQISTSSQRIQHVFDFILRPSRYKGYLQDTSLLEELIHFEDIHVRRYVMQHLLGL